jgi:hypothetical protein
MLLFEKGNAKVNFMHIVANVCTNIFWAGRKPRKVAMKGNKPPVLLSRLPAKRILATKKWLTKHSNLFAPCGN